MYISHIYKICLYEKNIIPLHLHTVSVLNILSTNKNSMWSQNDRIELTQVRFFVFTITALSLFILSLLFEGRNMCYLRG